MILIYVIVVVKDKLISTSCWNRYIFIIEMNSVNQNWNKKKSHVKISTVNF